MTIASIPDIVKEKFGAALHSISDKVIHLCQQHAIANRHPWIYFVHISVPFDFDLTPALCVHLTAIQTSDEVDPRSISAPEMAFRTDETRGQLILSAISLTIGADGVLRNGFMDGAPSTQDAIYQECIHQAQSAWLCMHTGMHWSPDLRIDTIKPAWRDQWVMH